VAIYEHDPLLGSSSRLGTGEEMVTPASVEETVMAP
jgi:hypothetical protein